MPSVESQAGRTLGEHRTYWQADQIDQAVATAKADLAAGRLPWISFKEPYSWADMDAGKGDAWAREIATKLAALPGPVWVAIHHEPEHDGPIAQWTAEQARLAPILRSAPNVAFTVILIAYDSLHQAGYSLDDVMPAGTTVDVLGIDAYNHYRAGSSCPDLLGPTFGPISAWAKAHHLPWALAETGEVDAAAVACPTWLGDTYRGLVADGGIAFSYFDTSNNSTVKFTITTPPKMAEFAAILSAAPSLPKLG